MMQSNRTTTSSGCFRCGQEGHWARVCPTRTPDKSPSSSSSPLSAGFRSPDGFLTESCLPCPCGAGSCRLLTSNTLANPGRRFYSCPAKLDKNCKFFKWVDQVRADQLINAPVCRCGAGVCRMLTENNGPNAGRIRYVCHLKEGDGRCGYSIWRDELEISAGSSPVQSALTQVNNIDHANFDRDKKGNLNHQQKVVESPAFDTSQHKHNSGVICLPLEGAGEVEEDSANVPSRKHYKRIRDEVDSENYVPDSVGRMEMPQAKLRNHLTDEEALAFLLESEETGPGAQLELSSQNFPPDRAVAVHSLSLGIQFFKAISVQQNCWLTAAIHQHLSTQLQGWWGRLAFHPSRFLMIPASKPSFSSIFPTPDPISVCQDVNIPDYFIGASSLTGSLVAPRRNDQSPLPVGVGAESLDVAFEVPSCLESSREVGVMLVMRGSISKAFRLAACCLENDLLAILEGTDVCDHAIMVREAEATFAALDQLSVDRQRFKDRVKEFIHRASLLAEMEQATQSEECCREMVNHCINEKMRLDEISSVNSEAVNVLGDCRGRLQYLHEEVSHAKDWLLNVEHELSCCEVELSEMERHVEEIGKGKEVLAEKYELASKELEDRLKLGEKRRAEYDAAKAAFEKARATLWG